MLKDMQLLSPVYIHERCSHRCWNIYLFSQFFILPFVILCFVKIVAEGWRLNLHAEVELDRDRGPKPYSRRSLSSTEAIWI